MNSQILSPGSPLMAGKLARLGISVGVLYFLLQLATGSQLVIVPVALVAAFLAFKYPEISLALFLKVGRYKGDPRVSALLPVDLTIVLAIAIGVRILIGILRHEKRIQMSKVHLCYFGLLLLMMVSMLHTPDVAAALDKAGRFAILTGLAIVAPFYVLNSKERLYRFLLTFLVTGLIASINAATMLGGSDRLVAPSGSTTQLGLEAAEALIVLTYLIIPAVGPIKRSLAYLIGAMLTVGLVGAGARSATIAVALTFLLALYFYRRLIPDFAILILASALMLAVVPIPTAAYDYLGTLLTDDPVQALSFRQELMTSGIRLTMEHPLFGVGLAGFPSYSPNAALYNWPHNVFIELSAELGLLAALLLMVLVIASFRVNLRLLRTRTRYDLYPKVSLALLILGLVTLINTGDINENRPMFLFMSIPFVLKGLIDSKNSELAPQHQPSQEL